MRTLVALLALSIGSIGCTQGATPDCAAVKCGPDLDGSVAADGTVEAASDAGDAAAEAADGTVDAPADAPSDG